MLRSLSISAAALRSAARGPARHRFGIEWIKWRYLRRRLAMLRSGAVMRQEVLARSASTSALAVSAAVSAFAWAASVALIRGWRSSSAIHAMQSITVSVAARSAATQGAPPVCIARQIVVCSGSAAGGWRRIAGHQVLSAMSLSRRSSGLSPSFQMARKWRAVGTRQ